MIKRIKKFFQRELHVHNYTDAVPAFMLAQWRDSLYVMQRNGKLYRLTTDVSGQTICEHVLTFNGN